MSTTTDPCSPDATPEIVPIDTSARRFRANVLANLLYFVFNAGLQLWFTRYLIDHLGVATYGLVPLATNMTNYMAILTVALSGSVGRFLTIDLARGDVETANKTFNTSLFATIVLAIALLPVVGALSWFSPHILNIPEGEENGTRFLLVCTGFAFLLNTVGSNFACSTFAKNRFDYQRAVDVVGQAVQVGVAVTLFSVLGAKLWQVGIGIAAMSVMRQAGYQITWRKLTPELRIRPRSFDRTRLREVLGMGAWLTVNQFGAVLFLQIDLLVVNMVIGAYAAGLYAPGVQMSTVLRSMAGLVTGVLFPTFAATYAVHDSERLMRISHRVVKVLGLAMALPVGLACGFARPLLTLWLGPEFGGVAPLVVLMLVHLSVNVAVVPLFGVNTAMNKVMWPGIVTCALGLVNLGLAILLAGQFGWGMYGVAAAGAIVLTAKNAVFTPMYAAFVLRQPLLVFSRAVAPCAVGTACVTPVCYCVSTSAGLSSAVGLLVAGLAVCALAVPVMAWLGLTSSDRAALRAIASMPRVAAKAF